MRNRCEPKVSNRYQDNLLAAGLSFLQEKPLNLAEIISEAPLSEIASFIRGVTASVGQKTPDDTMAKIAPIKDKSCLDMPLDSLLPLSFTTTDWRSSKSCDHDFGIGTPMAYRCLYNTVVENIVIMYPPHKVVNEGIEVMIPFETHALYMLTSDPAIKDFFDFRGVEVKSL